MEKYIAFMIDRNLIFIDSFQFMNQSLSDLADDLPKENFYHTKKEFGIENLELTTRKGVYPYDYMDDFNKFKEEGLPSIESFYCKLTSEILVIVTIIMFGKNLNVKQLGIIMIFI